MTAPAVISGDRPRPLATPIKPTPRVPATVHELPMLTEATAQISALAAGDKVTILLKIKVQVEYADFLTFSKNKPQEAINVLEKALTFSKTKFDKARIKLKLGDVLVFSFRKHHIRD